MLGPESVVCTRHPVGEKLERNCFAPWTSLAPVYDLVSTVPYLPKDGMALTLNGSTKWPDRKVLVRLGQTRCDLSLPAIKKIIEQAADVLAKLTPEITRYFNENSAHQEIGDQLQAAWQTGIRESLGFSSVVLG